MKKLLSVILAVMMLFALAACSSSGKEGVLRVGMECAYAPYNWSQSTDANGAVQIQGSSDYAYGYDVMIAKYVADKIGYDLEIYKMDWDSLPLSVQSGTIDCAIAGQSITGERMETVDFTTPYYYASIVVLAAKDGPYVNAKGVSDLAGATATSQINTVWYNTCLPQIPNVNKLAAMSTAPEMVVALNSGAAQIVVTDKPTAMAAVAAYPDKLVMLDFTGTDDDFTVSEEEINIGISVQKGNKELLDKINAVLAELTVEDFDRMMNEAISVQPLS